MTDDGFMGPPWQIDWARFVFTRRTADPQIVIEELFWQ